MADLSNIQPEETEFKGYTIDELRYRRAYAAAKYEIARMHFSESISQAKAGFTGPGRRGIVGKLLGSLNYVDYAILGFRVLTKIRKWRKKK